MTPGNQEVTRKVIQWLINCPGTDGLAVLPRLGYIEGLQRDIFYWTSPSEFALQKYRMKFRNGCDLRFISAQDKDRFHGHRVSAIFVHPDCDSMAREAAFMTLQVFGHLQTYSLY